MVMKIEDKVFWVVTPCTVVAGYQHFRGSMDLWNVGILPQHYTASQPRRPRLEISAPRKP